MIRPAIQAYNRGGVHWTLSLAQAALESGWNLNPPGNNLFGIKADSRWKGNTVLILTTEYLNYIPRGALRAERSGRGYKVKIYARFRAYPNLTESFLDHSRFLAANPRYRNVLRYRHDYRSLPNLIARAGYATDPRYSSKLVRLINQYIIPYYNQLRANESA